MRSPIGWGISDMRVWGGKLVMTGWFGLIADRDHSSTIPGIAAWDGDNWSPLGDGLHGTGPVLGVYQGDLVVAGWRLSIRNASPAIRDVARWNGTSWSGFGSGAPDDVVALQQFRSDLYACHFLGGLYRWDGATWSTIPGSDVLLHALGVTSDSPVVGGQFGLTSGIPSPNVAFWDGTNWRAAGAGVNDIVYATTNWNGRIVIGGRFTGSGATTMSGAAVWDGAAWQPLGSDLVTVFSLRGLFALGEFKLADDSVIRTVAHYVGPDWEPLGSGTNGIAFEGFGGHLYEGGEGVVNGHLSHGLA